jgi:hypothetical protein
VPAAVDSQTPTIFFREQLGLRLKSKMGASGTPPTEN